MKIGVIGGGNMGFAYVQSILNAKITDSVLVYEPYEPRREFLSTTEGIELHSALDVSLSGLDLIILAVKPQMFSEVGAVAKSFVNNNQVVVSIMAGISIGEIASSLGIAKVVRAMPNTPCQLGSGVTGYFCQGISTEEKTFVESVFATNGLSVEMEVESKLNEVTAVSGSGPAYFFTILKHMIDAGVEMGLNESQAKKMVLGTMKGSAELVEASDKPLDELIANVKSKGGTTEAALNSFAENKLNKVISKGLKAARDRSIALSKL